MDTSDAEKDAPRKYRKPVNYLTYFNGEFEYLQAADSAKEAAARGLLAFMSGLSEQYFGAGWSNNLEYILWDFREGGVLWSCVSAVDDKERQILKLLSEMCEGWWMYPDGDDVDPALHLMSFKQWRTHIENRWVHPGGFVTKGKFGPSI